MGRPPSHGGPCFRFNPAEVKEMEAILQAHNCAVPEREVLESLARKFSTSAERSGQPEISVKQVWNWFQNRRYALRAKAAKVQTPVKLSTSSTTQDGPATVSNVPQAPQPRPPPPSIVRSMAQPANSIPTPSGKNASDNYQMEFEAKSARDGAWYDVSTFLSHRSLEMNDPEVLVRFSGFGPEEDEWVNIRRHVRQRSLPCESSECIAVLPGDLILCFQEGKEQALYFDSQVLDAQRRRHDVRGCRCRFLVRYDHDQSEEIVPLRKICRRPETDYRLQELHAESTSAGNPQTPATIVTPQNQPKREDATGTGATSSSIPTNISASDQGMQEHQSAWASAGNSQKADIIETPQKQPNSEERPTGTTALSDSVPPSNTCVPNENKAPASIIPLADSNPSPSELGVSNVTAISTSFGGSGPRMQQG